VKKRAVYASRDPETKQYATSAYLRRTSAGPITLSVRLQKYCKCETFHRWKLIQPIDDDFTDIYLQEDLRDYYFNSSLLIGRSVVLSVAVDQLATRLADGRAGGDQLVVGSIEGHQLVVRSLLDDEALRHHGDDVGALDGGEAVGDGNGCSSLACLGT